jgi:hypothetical protein
MSEKKIDVRRMLGFACILSTISVLYQWYYGREKTLVYGVRNLDPAGGRKRYLDNMEAITYIS